MSELKRQLESGGFAVTAEMAPPKGCDFTEVLETAKLLKGCVHGVNVTDMQSASLKASSLGLCIHLKQLGLDPLVTLICLYVGYRLWGFWGLLFAPMLAGVLFSMLKKD